MDSYLRPQQAELDRAEASGRLDRGEYWAVRGSNSRWAVRTRGRNIASAATAGAARDILQQLAAGTHKSQQAAETSARLKRPRREATQGTSQHDPLQKKRGVVNNPTGTNQHTKGDTMLMDTPMKRSRRAKEMAATITRDSAWEAIEETLALQQDTILHLEAQLEKAFEVNNSLRQQRDVLKMLLMRENYDASGDPSFDAGHRHQVALLVGEFIPL